MTDTFTILGDGGWGTAIAVLLAQNPNHHVRLWSAREENGHLLQQHRENIRLLPGIRIPDDVVLTTDINEAIAGADCWISAVPTVYLRETFSKVRPHLGAAPPIVSLSKGLERRTFLRPSQILHEVVGAEQLAILSGPSHAEEVSRGMPTTVVIASEDPILAKWMQERFCTERFRVYTNHDPVGVELAGALKNIIGVAAGICDGMNLGDNAKAALLTRGQVEMARFGIALGAEPATFSGLAGIGDLITTCMSPHGRNREMGLRLARGETLEQIEYSSTKVTEGVYTTQSVYERARQMQVEMPITTEVYRVLYEKKSPIEAVNDLMMRDPKREWA